MIKPFFLFLSKADILFFEKNTHKHIVPVSLFPVLHEDCISGMHSSVYLCQNERSPLAIPMFSKNKTVQKKKHKSCNYPNVEISGQHNSYAL